MNATSPIKPPPGLSHHRKIKYIDHVLQKWLLLALVVLEVIVLSVAGAILYVRLNGIIDDNLYRVHFGGQPSMFMVLLNQSLRIIGGMIAVNLLALFVADRIWVHYVRAILSELRRQFACVRALDFRDDQDVHPRHKVLALAQDWRRVEKERHLAMLQSFDHMASRSTTSTEELRADLQAFRSNLPTTNLELAQGGC